MDERHYESMPPLTLHESGVSGKPTAYDKLMSSVQWKAAKSCTHPETGVEFSDSERSEGGMYVVRQLWSDKQTAELRRRIADKEPVFITMPSTTGQNTLPVVLGRVLQDELGGQLIDGISIAKAVHHIAMKDIPAENRPFVPREYVITNPVGLWKATLGKAVVVVEDVFSSGASAKAFCDSLSECKIQVTTVAGLLGDSRLTAEPQLVQKLAKTMKHSGMDGKAKDIAAVLSRGQIITLIDVINTRGKDELESITEGIQRVLNSRIARHMGQDSWRGTERGVGHSPGKNDGREGAGMGLQIESRSTDGRRHDTVEPGKNVGTLTPERDERDTGMER